MRALRAMISAAALAFPVSAVAQQAVVTPPLKPITFQAVAALTAPAPTLREAYGVDSSQFGELRVPKGKGRFPTIVLVHGGCWLSQYDYRYLTAMAQALADSGYAVWTIEFRRVGNAGGGWPNTFLDVGAATDHLRELARRFPIDTNRVVAVGHSAGGQLALWLPTRRHLAAGTPLYVKAPIRVRGVLSIDGIADMGAYARAKSVGCNAATPQLMGGMPDSVPDRYLQVDPIARVPLGVRSRLLQGYLDQIVPIDQARSFAARASAAGDESQWTLLEASGHFDAVSPLSPVFYHVLDELRSLFDR
jgi:acetyl esterase/lipase